MDFFLPSFFFVCVCVWGGVNHGYCWFLSPGGTGEAWCCKRTQVLPCYLQFNLPTGGQRKVGGGLIAGPGPYRSTRGAEVGMEVRGVAGVFPLN